MLWFERLFHELRAPLAWILTARVMLGLETWTQDYQHHGGPWCRYQLHWQHAGIGNKNSTDDGRRRLPFRWPGDIVSPSGGEGHPKNLPALSTDLAWRLAALVMEEEELLETVETMEQRTLPTTGRAKKPVLVMLDGEAFFECPDTSANEPGETSKWEGTLGTVSSFTSQHWTRSRDITCNKQT